MTPPLNPDTFICEFLLSVNNIQDQLSDPYDIPLGTNKTKATLPIRLRGKVGQLREKLRKLTDKFVWDNGVLTQKSKSKGGRHIGLYSDRRKLYRDEVDQLCATREEWYGSLSAEEKAGFDNYCLASAGAVLSSLIGEKLPACLHGPLARLALEAAETGQYFKRIRSETEKSLRDRNLSNPTVMPGILKRVEEDKAEAISRLIDRWFGALTSEQADVIEGPVTRKAVFVKPDVKISPSEKTNQPRNQIGPREMSGPHDLRFTENPRQLRRGKKKVEFRNEDRLWKLLIRLIKRHPEYYTTGDLGHDAFNPDSRNDDPSENTVQHDIGKLRVLLKPLNVTVLHCRGQGYRLEVSGRSPIPKSKRSKRRSRH